jgi:hypothetical protein
MHRIRHFKIAGQIVWDRTNKLDILTGSEQENGTFDGKKDTLLLESVYPKQSFYSSSIATT